MKYVDQPRLRLLELTEAELLRVDGGSMLLR